MSDALRSTQSESSTLSKVSQELAALVERAGRSTVLVGGGSFRPGTGTVVSPDLVLTASHVVESDEGIVVRTADNRAFDAVLVGRDPATGLALLRVENLDAPAITPASAEPRAGSLAAAVFRSWEGQLTARLAVVNGVAGPVRVGRGVRLEQVIRTDLGPARGLSGSPLVTADGEWLGLITAGLVRGVPLVIPHAVAAESIKAITARGGGKARRGYLGVALHPVRLPERQRAAIGGSLGDRGELRSRRDRRRLHARQSRRSRGPAARRRDRRRRADSRSTRSTTCTRCCCRPRSMRRCRSTCCAARPP